MMTPADVLTLVAPIVSGKSEQDSDLVGNDKQRAVRIALALRNATGMSLSVDQVRNARSATRLAALVSRIATRPDVIERSELGWIAGLPLPQWRFWYSEMKTPGNGDGIDTFAFRLHGDLDVTAITKAVQSVVVSHEALRTLIVRTGERGTRTYTVEPDHLATVLTTDDLDLRDNIGNRLRAYADRPFRLESDIPVRALLLRRNRIDHVLAICTHHSAFDGWSASLLMQHISKTYRAERSGNVIHQRDPTSYLRAWSEQGRDDDDSELLDWTRTLLGVPDLPLLDASVESSDAVRPIREEWIDLPVRLVDALDHAAAQRSSTRNSVMLTAWVRALRAQIGRTDFAVGVPVTGRTSATSLDTIGCFVSAVALRFTGSSATTFAQDLAATDSHMSQAVRFGYMPLETVMREEDTPRDRTRIPFCQAGFVSQQRSSVNLELDGLDSRHVPVERSDTAFELTLEVWTGDRPRARVWRRDDVLDDDRASALAQRWLSELAEFATQNTGGPR